MRKTTIYYSIFSLLTAVALCQDDSQEDNPKDKKSSGKEKGQGPGKVANTDTTKYAGVYDFTYFYNPNSKTAKGSAQLPCQNITGFTLDIPGGSGVDIDKDFSSLKDGVDPIYNTKQSSWIVKELAENKEFDTLKVSIFVNDMEDSTVCWGIKMVNKDIIVNLNPNNYTICPTRFIPATRTCLKDYAFLLGKCKSGPCMNDGSKARMEKSDSSKPGTSATSNANILYLPSAISLAVIVSLTSLYI